MLQTLVTLLAAAAVAVPLSRRAGFGSVLGYLLAGVAIGPDGLGLVTNVDQIAAVAELGIVMLLFLIGLELRPARLWVMRRSVFGLGTAQVVVSAAVLALLAHGFGALAWPGAVVLGVGLALSSTAIVLPMLAERDLLASRAGRDAFAVLLFQDLAFIPLIALVPLLGGAKVVLPWRDVAVAAGAVAVILVGGRYLLPRVFRLVGGARVPETFTILALLTVAGTAELASVAGLSQSLGAFMAGVLLSESEYRHELQADIEPFEGFLLGLFFTSVGMSADLSLLVRHPVILGVGLLILLATKIAIGFGLGRAGGHDTPTALRFAVALPQGSEFSFVLFAAAVGVGAMAEDVSQAATLVIALSMAATPLLFAASESLLMPWLRPAQREPVYDAIEGSAPVIIAGFGRVGQIVGRVLRTQGIAFTALEKDPGQVEVIRRFGAQIFYGDSARPDLLRAAGAETAKLLVVAIENTEENLQIVEVAKRTFPNLKILARARNRRHAHLLMDRGVRWIVRDTFLSSLKLAADTLEAMGLPAERAQRAVAIFRAHDEKLLLDTHAIYRNEQQMIQTTQQAADELRDLFEADRPGAPDPTAAADA
jgi:monovalent cation:proton antiporter-2 (CPA2) family protein